MLLELKRIKQMKDCTIGQFFVDGEYLCDTLEDVDRGLDSSMSLEDIKAAKIYGETAIPSGEYKVTVGDRIRLLDVPGYTGILIHAGNSAKDTKGCLLLGKWTGKPYIISSREAVNKFRATVNEAEDLKIRITRNY